MPPPPGSFFLFVSLSFAHPLSDPGEHDGCIWTTEGYKSSPSVGQSIRLWKISRQTQTSRRTELWVFSEHSLGGNARPAAFSVQRAMVVFANSNQVPWKMARGSPRVNSQSPKQLLIWAQDTNEADRIPNQTSTQTPRSGMWLARAWSRRTEGLATEFPMGDNTVITYISVTKKLKLQQRRWEVPSHIFLSVNLARSSHSSVCLQLHT